jgi:hypothetical protein
MLSATRDAQEPKTNDTQLTQIDRTRLDPEWNVLSIRSEALQPLLKAQPIAEAHHMALSLADLVRRSQYHATRQALTVGRISVWRAAIAITFPPEQLLQL